MSCTIEHPCTLILKIQQINEAVSPQLCLSTGEDGKILIFTALGSVIKNDLVGDYLLTGSRWTTNGEVMLAAYGKDLNFIFSDFIFSDCFSD